MTFAPGPRFWKPGGSSGPAARLHGAALLAVLLAQADRFVVVTFWDDATLGLYVIALTFAAAGLDVVTGAFNVLLLPRLAAARDTGAQRRIMGQTLRYATLLLTAGTAVLLLICPWLSAVPVRRCLHRRRRDLSRIPRRLSADRAAEGHHLRPVGTGDWRPRIVAQALALGVFAAAVWPLAGRLGVLGVPTALLIANAAAWRTFSSSCGANWDSLRANAGA